MRTFLLAALLLGAEVRADTTEIWRSKCKSCHGVDGSAQTASGKNQKIPDMRDRVWQEKFSDEEIRKNISDGSAEHKKMKAFKTALSAEEIGDLIKHIRVFRKDAATPAVKTEPKPAAPTSKSSAKKT